MMEELESELAVWFKQSLFWRWHLPEGECLAHLCSAHLGIDNFSVLMVKIPLFLMLHLFHFPILHFP
jgi:hypothetical protein